MFLLSLSKKTAQKH